MSSDGKISRQLLEKIIQELDASSLPTAFIWLWVWDQIKVIVNTCQKEGNWNEFYLLENVTLESIWESLWSDFHEDIWTSFNLTYGYDSFEESIVAWLEDNEFIEQKDE